jgi:hypothetical protein
MSTSTQPFQVGDTVKYEKWDGEEGRSYGWFLATKQAKIVSICYKLDNGDILEAAKLVKVEDKKNQTTTQNGGH